MADIQALRASKNQAKSNTDWPRFSLFFDKVLLISKQNNFQKKFFSATGARNVAGKSIPKIWNLEKIWISGDNILWCSVDHILLLWFLCSGHGSVMLKRKKELVRQRSCLKITENAIFWHFLIEICTDTQKTI